MTPRSDDFHVQEPPNGPIPDPTPVPNANAAADPTADLATWAALLAHWTRLAQAAAALPTRGDGPKWRRSVPAIIHLQALTHALAGLERLPFPERSVGLDRAAVAIDQQERALDEVWKSVRTPEGIVELLTDARSALLAAQRIHGSPRAH